MRKSKRASWIVFATVICVARAWPRRRAKAARAPAAQRCIRCSHSRTASKGAQSFSSYAPDELRAFAPQATSNAAAVLADRIEGLVSHLGLPTRLRSFDIGLPALADIAKLLRENYPAEVNDLGPDADRKLHALMLTLW